VFLAQASHHKFVYSLNKLNQMNYLIDTIEHLSVLVFGNGLSDEDREKLNELTEQELNDKVSDLKGKLYGF
jgi:hypothetical protein